MAEYNRTLGFVFSKINTREADQLFNIYTKDFGKVEVLGRAIRKIKSKLRAGAEIFWLSEIEFVQGRAYKTLTDAIKIEKFKNIKNNFKKLEVAYKIRNIANSFIKGSQKDERIFNLICEVFNLLDKSKAKDAEIFYYYFFWNIVSFLGYKINFYNCVFCHNSLIPKNLYFNPEQSGVVCLDCAGKGGKHSFISPEAIKILRIILKKDFETLIKIKLDKEYKDCLKKISQDYFCHLKSLYC
jgi:DNA repair protein RecO (recombination protein O)